MTPTRKNEKISTTLRGAPTTPAKPKPTPLERHAAAKAARDRLGAAKAEAFPRSAQYRPAGDGNGIAESDAK